jgi:uncharacterized membrane protein (UPF0127 family)
MVAAAALVVSLAACQRAEGPRARIHTATGVVEVTLEVADTPATLQRGLMYRSSLPDDHGMLFVFPTESVHDFWMKNTLIPLDMLFITSDRRIVGIRANTTPLSTTPVGVGRPTRWVLEVPGGYAARRGIAPGDEVELLGIPSG